MKLLLIVAALAPLCLAQQCAIPTYACYDCVHHCWEDQAEMTECFGENGCPNIDWRKLREVRKSDECSGMRKCRNEFRKCRQSRDPNCFDALRSRCGKATRDQCDVAMKAALGLTMKDIRNCNIRCRDARPRTPLRYKMCSESGECDAACNGDATVPTYRRVEMPFSMLPASFKKESFHHHSHPSMHRFDALRGPMPAAERFAGPDPFVKLFRPRPTNMFAANNNRFPTTSRFGGGGGPFGGSRRGSLIGVPFMPPMHHHHRRPTAKLCEQMVKTAQAACGPRRVVEDPTIVEDGPAMQDPTLVDPNEPIATDEEIFDADIMPVEPAPQDDVDMMPVEPTAEGAIYEEEMRPEQIDGSMDVSEQVPPQWDMETTDMEEPVPADDGPVGPYPRSLSWDDVTEELYRKSPYMYNPSPPAYPAVMPSVSLEEKKEQRRLVLQAAIFVMNSGSAAEMEINCDGFHDAMDAMKGRAVVDETAPPPGSIDYPAP